GIRRGGRRHRLRRRDVFGDLNRAFGPRRRLLDHRLRRLLHDRLFFLGGRWRRGLFVLGERILAAERIGDLRRVDFGRLVLRYFEGRLELRPGRGLLLLLDFGSRFGLRLGLGLRRELDVEDLLFFFRGDRSR